MDPNFWHERWAQGQIGFHEPTANDLLVAHDARLGADGAKSAPGTVLVPLCGKSRDLAHLAELGHRVVGVELSPLAAEAFFAESGLTPLRSQRGPFEVFESHGVAILVGDVFALDEARDLLPPIDAIYDRAALVALPPEMQARYAPLLASLLPPGGRMLLVAFDYDQTKLAGPPFSVPAARIEELYGATFAIERLDARDVSDQRPRFREVGADPVTESVYLLTRR